MFYINSLVWMRHYVMNKGWGYSDWHKVVSFERVAAPTQFWSANGAATSYLHTCLKQ